MLEGTVASLQPYGAFVALGENLNGLLHISQISHDRVSSVEQVLQLGQKLKVRARPLQQGLTRWGCSSSIHLGACPSKSALACCHALFRDPGSRDVWARLGDIPGL